MFELDQFVSDCRAALRENMAQRAVQEVVLRAVSAPGDVLRAIGEPKRAEMQTLYRSDDLTILNVIWAPWMNLLPHNHQMWQSLVPTRAAKIIFSGVACRKAMASSRLPVRGRCAKKMLSRWVATLFILSAILFQS